MSALACVRKDIRPQLVRLHCPDYWDGAELHAREKYMRPRASPEFAMQAALFNWAELFEKKYPVLRLLRGSLNGVHLSKAQAGKAKAAGMKKGEHDVTLMSPRGGYTGLSIELKCGKNKPTTDQLEYGECLKSEGWFVAYCWEWTEAADLIKRYLEERL